MSRMVFPQGREKLVEKGTDDPGKNTHHSPFLSYFHNPHPQCQHAGQSE